MPTTFDDKQKQFESLMNQADEARLEKEAALDRYKQAAIYGNILSSPRAANKAEILSGVTPVNYSEGMQKAWEQPAKIDVESAQGRYQSVLDKYKALKEESDAEKNRALLEKQLKTEQTKNSIGDGLLYSGIDRIDSNDNYTKENSVPCCRICNYAKSNMDVNDFQEWAIKIGQKAMAEQCGNFIKSENVAACG